MPDSSSPALPEIARPEWMALLARARPDELENAWRALSPAPSYAVIRKPEIGLVMVRGRSGGTGQPFNLGEMTMTRCAIRLDNPQRTIGLAFVAGRDARHAELAALFDAILQEPAMRRRVGRELLERVQHRVTDEQRRRAGEAAATRVDFFTLVREQESD